MKRNYSYFIIKPDGIRFINKIFEKFNENFNEIRFFRIEDYESVIKKLYFRHYQTKGEKFAKSFEQYLQASRSIFGKEALLTIVADPNNNDYDIFRQKVYDIKMAIREEFMDLNVCLVSNENSEEPKNYIKIVNLNGEEIKSIYSGKMGNYRINNLNVIHCPDTELKSTCEELKILCDLGVINEKNLLGNKNIEELLKYGTLNGFEPNDKEHKPNISDFVVHDIAQQL